MSYFPSRTVLLLPLVSISVAAATMAPVDLSWRSLGMGGAGVAIADDGDALHENPAGLTQIAWPGCANGGSAAVTITAATFFSCMLVPAGTVTRL